MSERNRIPDHYNIEGLEAIDIIYDTIGKAAFIGYCHGTAMKYLLRAIRKGEFLTDIIKARDFLNFIIESYKKDGRP